MFHKVKFVAYNPDYKLTVQFSEGVTKIYDLKQVINKIEAFKIFEERPYLMEDVKVDTGGYGIIWNDELDLSCDELWKNGKIVKTAFDNLLALSDATVIWGLNESTLRKAISYGKFINGVDVCKYGKQWVITMEAMKRVYGEPKKHIN
ncbi:MAG: DUF2442 domain-containing protein [Bacilli bacterium]|nr:DUF2442 domain-containing protein [Bacilli bacterium]